jgi:hypothetical protein
MFSCKSIDLSKQIFAIPYSLVTYLNLNFYQVPSSYGVSFDNNTVPPSFVKLDPVAKILKLEPKSNLTMIN